MFVSILTLNFNLCNEIFIAICGIFICFVAINFYSKRLTVYKKAVMIKKNRAFKATLYTLYMRQKFIKPISYVFQTLVEQTANTARFIVFCILLRHVVFLRRKVDRKIYKSVLFLHMAAARLDKANG